MPTTDWAGELASQTWTTIPPRPLVLVPVGSVEQHGPHLPLDTDTVIAVAVCAAVHATLISAHTLLVAPAITYGSSGEHQGFPGTVSIGTSVLHDVLVETTRSLATWAGAVLFVNAHGGNLAALTSAVPQLIAEGHSVSWVPCAVPGADAHAGRTETSLMMHLAPQKVRTPNVETGVTEPLARLMPRLRAGGVRAVSPNGVLGDPRGATEAEGRRLFDAIVTDVRQRLDGGGTDQRGCLTAPALSTSPCRAPGNEG